MVAVWSSVLVSLVVGVASQAPLVPPVVAGVPPVVAGTLNTFNPMAAITTTPLVQHGISDALNAAINGNSAAMTAAEQEAINEVPSASARFVDGFIGGYLEDVVLQTGEKQCIRKNIHSMTKDGVALISEMASVITELVDKQTPNAIGLMAGAGQIIELGTTTQALIKLCVKADAAAVMHATANHLKNPAYVQGRLLANGLEIMKVFADSIQSAEVDNWLQVGEDFGRMMRKTLLSDNEAPVQLVLQEGMEASQVGPTVVQGVIEGMFVQGATVAITSVADPTINIFIDLHDCIAEEAPYMTTVMNTLYLAISQLSVQIERMQLAQKGIAAGMGDQTGAAPMAGGMAGGFDLNSLSPLMTNIPTMLDRCGITVAQRGMMKKAFKDMHDLKAAFTIPGPSDKSKATNEAAKRVEDATKYWQMGDYVHFGQMTGGLMRDLLLAAFPSPAPPPARLYNADWANAHLSENNHAGSFALTIGGLAAVMLLGLAVAAVFRIKQSSQEHRPTLLSSEATDCEEDIE